MSSHFVKLYGSILTSSIWAEDPATRLVWITMLAMADADGFVKASPSGLARFANVPATACRKALAILEGPDIESGNKDYGGRRIDPTEGGWTLLNYSKYRDFRTREQALKSERQARWRAGKSASTVDGVDAHVDAGDRLQDGERRVEVEVEVEVEGIPSRETSKGKSGNSVGTSLVKTDSVPWINQALATIKDNDFEDHRLLWEGRTVFSYWVWRRNKFLQRSPTEAEQTRVIFTKDRKARVNKWLTVYGLEDCLLAAEGLFHHQDMQQKDGTSYTEFENVFRPQGGGTLEKLRDEGLRHRKPVDSILKRLREQGWHE